MASASRTFSRALRTAAPSFRSTTTRSARFAVPAQNAFRSRRGYATGNEEAKDKYEGNPTGMFVGAGILLVGAAGYAAYTYKPELLGLEGKPRAPFVPRFENYQEVYNHIAKLLEEHNDYDDGSYGPVLLRLAWHASGTYDKLTNTGGSNGATMRFAPEGDHGANAGLKAARDFLEPVDRKSVV